MRWLYYITMIILFLVVVQLTNKTLSFEVTPGKWVPIINLSWGQQT